METIINFNNTKDYLPKGVLKQYYHKIYIMSY